MKKTKTIISGVLCLSMIMGMTACDESGGVGGQTLATTEEDFTVDIGEITLDIEENQNIEGAVIDYLGCYDITKAGDVKPAVTYFEENYKASIQVEILGDSEIMEKLAQRIQSGDSPDLVDQRSNSFPYYITQNTYMSLDDYMDLNAPQWKDVASIVDGYAINGKHYYYPWAIYMCNRILCYNRGKMNSFGLEDPRELYEKGEWTWDKFYEIMQEFVTKARNDFPDAIGVYGSVAQSFIDTTGTPLVGFKDGQLVNNLQHTDVGRAQEFLENCKKQGLARLDLGDYGYNNVDTDPVILGYAAFQSVGDWAFGGYSKKQAKDPDMDFMFVPLPRDPTKDKHYITLSTMAYLVPSGAKDVEAACVFINCMRLSKTDASIQSVVKESIMKANKYNEEQWNAWMELQDPTNFDIEALVSDLSFNLDADTCDKIISKICEDVPFVETEELPTWTAKKEGYANALNDAINSINADLK